MDGDDLRRLLIERTDARKSHDLDRLMGLFADDCTFEASGGPDAIAEVGTHDALMAATGRYHRLYQRQFRDPSATLEGAST